MCEILNIIGRDRALLRIDVRGIVQGVGFRPFIHRLVERHGLTGWVRNSSEGAELELEGPGEELAAFLRELETEAPPLALIESVSARAGAARTLRGLPHNPQREGRDHAHARLAGRGYLPGLPARAAGPGGQALPLPLHKLHELRAAVYHNPFGTIRPCLHLNGRVPDVRGLRGGVCGHTQQALPRAAGLLPCLRAEDILCGCAGAQAAGGRHRGGAPPDKGGRHPLREGPGRDATGLPGGE